MAAEGETDPLDTSRELIRAAAKWLTGALGAIGVVLVAGSQLSSIGDLSAGWRLLAAMAGLAVGLAAVLYAIWRTTEMLLPVKSPLSGLARDWEASGAVSGQALAPAQARRYPAIDELARNPEYLGGYSSIPEIRDTLEGADPDDENLPDLIAMIDRITSIASYVTMRTRFDRLRWHVAVAVGAAAVGITTFAWAANPPEPGERPPVLRGADLRGADLSGVRLIDADLREATLVDATLIGAQLEGANIEDVVWGNTVCPDGTNSDQAGDTCEGHLSP